jgi:hypothetical protein
MKIIDLSTLREANGKIPFTTWLKKTLGGGQQWQAELDAQDQVMVRLERTLGNDFTLIREVQLPGLGTPIPMVLVGPSGIFVLYASAVKGSFRARGDAWLKLDNSGNMHSSNPNLPTRTRLYSEAVRKFLSQNNMPTTDIEPVLLFSQPEAFVENIKAPIRMVMCDGLESYGGSLRLLNPIFSPEECADIVRLLSNPEGKPTVTEEISAEVGEIAPQPVIMPSDEPPMAEPVQEADFLPQESLRSAFVEPPAPEPIPIPPVIEEAVEQAPQASFSISAVLARTHMKTSQLTFLGVAALVDFLVICGLLAFVLLRMMR